MNIRKIALTIYAAAVLALFSSPAMTFESYVLSQHGDWTVKLEVTDLDEMLCVAVTKNNVGETLDIRLHATGRISVYFWFDNSETRYPNQEVKIDVQDIGVWTVPEPEMFANGWFFKFKGMTQSMEFALDLQKGRAVSITRPFANRSSGRFSLRGSRDAIDALYNCLPMITGVAS